LLQLAVDTETIDDAHALVDAVYPHFDIVEIGTPLIIAEGVRAVKAIKDRWPDKLCLADAKIMDAGSMEADIAFRSGADIVTVLGCADDSTIAGVVEAARKSGKWVMADLINCADIAGRARQLETMGVDILCVHAAVDTGSDAQGLFRELAEVGDSVDCHVAIAGGISEKTLPDAVFAGADIVVVGSAISRAHQPAEAAASMLSALAESAPTSPRRREQGRARDAVQSPVEIIGAVSKEIGRCTERIETQSVVRLLDEIDDARRVFVAAAGRSGFGVRGFAMRLMHMGRDVHVVGDVTTPSIAAGDLLLIGSGSGSTGSLVNMANKARSLGARIALVTIDPCSPIGEIADAVVTIPAPSPKARNAMDAVETVQPMGSLFEQSMSVLLDSMVVMLMQRHGLNSDDMFKRHANLE